MMTEKSQWRKDADDRIAKAKSPSQALRFAIFEEYQQKGYESEVAFDKFYNDRLSTLVCNTLDVAEEIHKKNLGE